jgi:hypothetical protein
MTSRVGGSDGPDPNRETIDFHDRTTVTDPF